MFKWQLKQICTEGEVKESCKRILTEHECQIALNAMKNNKSPGSDGIPVTAELYKTVWNIIRKWCFKLLVWKW